MRIGAHRRRRRRRRGLTDNAQQVKGKDAGKQCGQRGQAMMTVPVFFCTVYLFFFV